MAIEAVNSRRVFGWRRRGEKWDCHATKIRIRSSCSDHVRFFFSLISVFFFIPSNNDFC